MVQPGNRYVVNQSTEMLDTACEACVMLCGMTERADYGEADALCEDLRAMTEALSQALQPLLPELLHAYVPETLENISVSLRCIKEHLKAQDGESARKLAAFQLYPFLSGLKASLYFYGTVYPDTGLMKRYYESEFATQYRSPFVPPRAEPKYKLSVMIPAYNHLETTKQCVEHILKYTDFDALNAELILIDHGSTDGTLEYFRLIPANKVIHFKKNNRMFVFTAMAQAAEGEFFAYVSSDVLVTKGWAEYLLSCMESDPRIIAAAPATPHTANLQAIGMPPLPPQEFVTWANENNRDDSQNNEDRTRLMPTIAMYRTAQVHEIGFADPYFYSMEFWDDDFGLRARRAGYRQVLCPSIACYHVGSVTGGEAQQTENTMKLGLDLFRNKHGVDPWNQGVCYDYDVSERFAELVFPPETVRILGLDCGFGDMLLRFRNILRRQGKRVSIDALTQQDQYLADLTRVAERAAYHATLSGGFAAPEAGNSYEVVYLGRDISCYEEPEELFRLIAERLTPDGVLFITCDNPFYMPRMEAQMHFALPDGKERYTVAVPTAVHGMLGRFFEDIQIHLQYEPSEGTDGFIRAHYNKDELPERFQKELDVKRYLFLCRKRSNA